MPTIAERINAFNEDRLPEYRSLKYRIMADNAFSFFRGTCHLFYEDLSGHNQIPFSPPGWVCGDLHLANFGSYKGDNRLVYFDMNDFDEGLLAPVALEVLRMITSIFTGCESLGIHQRETEQIAALFLRV